MESPLVVAQAASSVHWGFVACLVALSALHYVLAALTLRGAAPCRFPLGEATLAQFTAAAANRLTPGGLGGAAVNTRYLVSHGTPAVRAAAAVAAMQVAGSAADLLLLLAVLSVTSGARDAAGALADRVSGPLAAVPLLPVLAACGLVAVAAAALGRRAVRSPLLRDAAAGLADLLGRPADLCLTLAASAATTLVLAVALALSVLAVPGTGAAPDDLAALLVAYMIGSAAAAALPAPGGLGGTEAALVGTVTALGVAAGPALQAVLLFRAITYWAPVPVGLLGCGTLRAKRAGGSEGARSSLRPAEALE